MQIIDDRCLVLVSQCTPKLQQWKSHNITQNTFICQGRTEFVANKGTWLWYASCASCQVMTLSIKPNIQAHKYSSDENKNSGGPKTLWPLNVWYDGFSSQHRMWQGRKVIPMKFFTFIIILRGYSLSHDQVVLDIWQRCWLRVLKVDESTSRPNIQP